MLEIEDSIYKEIKSILEQTRNKVYKVANSTMVEAYWNIGRVIVEKQGGSNKAEYGTALIKNLSKKSRALSDQLSSTHYRLLMRVEN